MTMPDLSDLKVIIKSIIISSPKPITVGELQRDYKSSEGREIPFSAMGFRNIWDFLDCLKDSVEILPDRTLRAVQTSETKHLQDLITKQRNPRKGSRSRYRGSGFRPNSSSRTQINSYSYFQYNQQRSSYSRNQSGAWSKNQNSGGKYSAPQYQPPPLDTTGTSHSRNNSYNTYGFDGSTGSSEDSFEIVNCSSKKASGDQATSRQDDTERNDVAKASPWIITPSDNVVACQRNDMSTAVPNQLKNSLREIISEHPSGVLCSQLSRLHSEKFSKPVDSRDYDFCSMIELIDAIPDLYKYEDKENKDWIIFNNQDSSPDVFEKYQAKVRERILTVARTLECPINIAKFDELYEKTYEVSLSSEVRSFGSIDSVLGSMHNSFIHMNVVDGLRVIMPPRNKVSSEETNSFRTEDTINYPVGALPFGSKVRRLDRFSDAIVPLMEVKLGEIYGPHNFYMLSCHTLKAHNLLMERMQTFYAHDNELALTNVPVRRGLYCVAPYMDKWHRAIITNVVSPVLVRVFLIDFGTQLPVPKSKLRYLHLDFAAQPRQAIKANLHGVVPSQNAEKFSKEANLLFFELAADKNLKAFVKGVNFFKEATVSVRLVDASEDNESSIDKKLVAAGLAEFIGKVISTKTSEETGSAASISDEEKNTEEKIKPQVQENLNAPGGLSPGAHLLNMLARARRLA